MQHLFYTHLLLYIVAERPAIISLRFAHKVATVGDRLLNGKVYSLNKIPYIDECYQFTKVGKVATYIPELAKAFGRASYEFKKAKETIKKEAEAITDEVNETVNETVKVDNDN